MTQVVKTPDGHRLSVESLGDPWGKPVFLFHGTPGVGRGPRPRGIVLHRLGIRLISYDRPGYPGSDRRDPRSVGDAAYDVAAIADYLRIDQFSVVGRSGGAPHALACAAILNKQVVCAATLSSLAPYDAEGLDWSAGMTEFNVSAYRNAQADLGALIATLNEKAGQVRVNPEGLLKQLWPELVSDDKDVIGDITLRRIIAQVHAEALRETADGWIDDVVALSRPWGFNLSDIKAPVKLWHGSNDVFSPVGHAYWLSQRIPHADLKIETEQAHFGSVEILVNILRWVAEQADSSPHITPATDSAPVTAAPVTAAPVTAAAAR
ncbi:MAG: alpha/beta fold hydrolase [Streptosporangiaceae bacterium]